MRRRFSLISTLMLTAAVIGGGVEAQAPSPGLAGPYLAARAAIIDGDHGVAATYFEEALQADPGNTFLISNALFANAALGAWSRADAISEMSAEQSEGRDLAQLVQLVVAIRDGDLITARDAVEADRGAGPFVDPLINAWIAFGEGDLTRATELLQAAAEIPGLADLAYTHMAMSRAAAGDFEGAQRLFSGEEVGRLSVSERTIRARAEVLEQLGEREAAVEYINLFLDSLPDPALLALRNRIANAESPPEYTFVNSTQKGVAEAFFAVGRAVASDSNSITLPLLYARAAHGIDPTHTEALMLAAELLSQDGQYELAADAYVLVPPSDPQYVEAQIARAEAYFALEQEDAAIDVLETLAESHPGVPTIHATLGDLLRRSGSCEDAIGAYTTAFDLIGEIPERYWFLLYARGNCFGILGDYAAAEADYRQALVLNPDQPQVLNNLGYSLVERRERLDEALDMIVLAAEGDPDSGYIIDSLGWILYRLERFEEAVEPMERAIALQPNDPIINDHLGDVYWMVGRYREAEFQWHRALSFGPEPEEADRIRRKLDVGLYIVLEEEGGVGAAE